MIVISGLVVCLTVLLEGRTSVGHLSVAGMGLEPYTDDLEREPRNETTQRYIGSHPVSPLFLLECLGVAV